MAKKKDPRVAAVWEPDNYPSVEDEPLGPAELAAKPPGMAREGVNATSIPRRIDDHYATSQA